MWFVSSFKLMDDYDVLSGCECENNGEFETQDMQSFLLTSYLEEGGTTVWLAGSSQYK